MSRLEQQRQALADAHRIRTARSAVKRAMAAGTLSLRRALEHPAVQTMALPALLVEQPWWGDVRTRRALKTLQSAGVNRWLLVGELSRNQRLLVVVICLSHEPVRVQAEVLAA